MADHNDTGKQGEALALEHLRQLGWSIEAENWRYSRSEVDIIAKEGPVLVFVEVKTRSTDYFGKPETFINQRKQQMLARAASAYMEFTQHDWEIRFDVISIVLVDGRPPEIRHLRDAFFPGL